MEEVPISGEVCVIVNLRGDCIKLLCRELGGSLMYCKLLETGRFRIPNRKQFEHRKLAIT